MQLFDFAVLVVQLAIIVIGAVTAAVTRSRQEFDEYYWRLEDFPNPESPWPLILVVVGSSLIWLGEVYWALTFPRTQALLFLSVLLFQLITLHTATRRVVAGLQETR